MIGDVTKAPLETSKPVPRGEQRKQDAAPKNTLDEPVDKVTLNEKKEEPVTYSKPTVEQEIGAKYLLLRELVTRMFRDQGIANLVDAGDGKTIDIAEMTPQQAEELVADDGYWGVEKTSGRIVEFAVGVAGNDLNKLEEIKEGVRKGFKLARKDFGMALPEISQKTYDATMEKLDRWAEELRKAAEGTAADAPED